MNLRLLYLLVSLLFPASVHARLFPPEGAVINYRITGFSFIPGKGPATIEIATGHYVSRDSFRKNICIVNKTLDHKSIIELPVFGKEYTWCVSYPGKNGATISGPLYHFTTGNIPEVDTGNIRLRVMNKTGMYDSDFIFVDGTTTLYDMKGEPVWFLPGITQSDTAKTYVRDLKLSRFGTITYVIDDHGAWEVNYNGEVQWKAPDNGRVSGDTTEHYHHEFTRLSNGHYMVLGNETVFYKRTRPGDKKLEIFQNPPKETPANSYGKLICGTLIEYDSKGRVVWSWKSSKYVPKSDIFYHRGPGGMPMLHLHENGFFFDETHKAIYLSMRDANRVLKIKYPQGTVLNTYGDIYNPAGKKNGMFCHQHSCRIADSGYLYLYNNNLCDTNSPPEIIMLQEPKTPSDTLKKIWDYPCVPEQTYLDGHSKYGFGTGGNVYELPDHALFVNMGVPYSKLLIVNRNKDLLWSALPEKWNPTLKKWEPLNTYRASIISGRKALERLIWKAEEAQPIQSKVSGNK